MSTALRFVPPRVPLVDPRTGIVSREWYLFLQGVFERIGGTNSESLDDVVVQNVFDGGSAGLATVSSVAQDALLQLAMAPDNTAAVAVLRNLLAALSASVDDGRLETALISDQTAQVATIRQLSDDRAVESALSPESTAQVAALRQRVDDNFLESLLSTPRQEVPEQGLWTPTLGGSTAAGTNTYTFQYGKWHRYRNQVTAHFYVRLASTAGMTGNLQLLGLPFNATSEGSYKAVGGGFYWANLLTAVLSVSGTVRPGNNFVDLFAPTAAAANVTSMLVGAVQAASELAGSISYSL